MLKFSGPVGRACLTAGFALFFPVLVLAQAVAITGVSESGNQLIITGAGFGSHGDYGGSQPFLNAGWNDFATGLNGGNLGLDGTNNAAWTYQTSGGRASGKRWARKDYISSIDDSIRRLGALALNMSGTTGSYYSSFWLRCGAGVDQAAKFWRIYGTNVQNVFLSITDGDKLMSFSNVSGSPSPTTVWGTVADPIRCATAWQRFEIFMRDTPGNDLIEVHIDGVMAFRRGSNLPSVHRDVEGSTSNERQQWVATPWGGEGHSIDFGHMVDGAFFGFSDTFVDFTRARVELSDQPTWVLARHKEIQVPMQWTSTRTTVQLNRGAFQVGQTVYVYVVDSNGNVNPVGFPYVIGGGGGSSSSGPAAPTNLRIAP
jgi:hypothetical protein